MNITILQPELVRALSRLQGITERKSTVPMLSHILLEAHDDTLQVSATDTELGITSICKCQVRQSGTLAVNSKQIYEISRALENKEVHLSQMDNWWLHVECGSTDYKIVGLNPVDFPRINFDAKLPVVRIPARTLTSMIERTIFCTSLDDSRQYLRGVYCEWNSDKPAVTMVATDGHRLALAEETLAECPPLPSIIVPRKAFAELRRLLSEVEDSAAVELSFSEKRGQIKLGSTMLSITLIDGKFPNYRRVIPTANNQILRVKRTDFISALRRVAVLAKDEENSLNITPHEGSVTIVAQNPEAGEGKTELAAEFKGASFTACFNARYLIEVLSLHSCETVQIEMAGEISPTLIRDPSTDKFLAVVMPIRP
jgi:DNA polymerase III subunit beta